MDSCRDKKNQARKEFEQNSVTGEPTFIKTEAPGTEDPTGKFNSPDLAFVFNPTRDQTKPYHLDGDTTMYTETALAQRSALKAEPLLVASITEFSGLYKSDSDGTIGKNEYERMYNKLCNILRPTLDALERKKLMDEDWRKDSKGMPSMSRAMLLESLFELCDVWTPNIDAREYATFFEQLRFRIRYEGQQDSGAYDILG